MLRTTLANLRAHWSRLVAVSVAVMLAVAFVAATLMLNASFQQTLQHTIGSDLANTDVVVSVKDDSQGADAADADADASSQAAALQLTTAQLRRVQQTPQVEVAAAQRQATVALAHGDQSQTVSASVQLPESLRPHALTEGAWVTADNQLTMNTKAAEQLGLHVGDQVGLTAGNDRAAVSATLIGLTEDSMSPSGSIFPQIALTESTLADVLADALPQSGIADAADVLPFTRVLVQARPGVTPEDARDAIARALGDTVAVRTSQQVVSDQVKAFTGEADALTGTMLAFAVISLIVCVLVIANTFSVIVAQRTRELALLRCLGASRGQVRSSVLVEALLMSVAASLAGVGLAAAMMSGVVALSKSSDTAILTELAIPPSTVVIGLVIGVLVTLIAAWQPARSATRVAPLAALRPQLAPAVRTRGGRVRLVIGLITLAAGTALQWFGWASAHQQGDDEQSIQQHLLVGLGSGVAGSALSIIGVLLLSIFVVPPLVRMIGSVFALTGVPGRMAALNASRNPRRTAATASALLIGVTLVSTVFTGASIARSTLTSAVDDARPVDVTVYLGAQSRDHSVDQQWVDETLSRLDGIEEVQSTGIVRGVLTAGDDLGIVDGQAPSTARLTQLEAVNAQMWQRVAKAPLPEVSPDTVTVVDGVLTSGDATLVGANGGTESLAVRHVPRTPFSALVDEPTLERAAAASGSPIVATRVIMQLAPGLNAQEVQTVADQIGTVLPDDYVMPTQLEKLMYQQVIDVLLSIVTGLLAIAIIIAVIGVTNTLSLSVIERVRENALLRALGLTRWQLRAMLGMESVLVSIVATVIGLMLGTAYGLLGAGILFAQTLSTGVSISWQLPWSSFALFIGIAVVVGLIASVLPARRAARLSPVAGLSSE